MIQDINQDMKDCLIDLDEMFYAEEGDDNIISFKASHPLVRKLVHLVERLKKQT